MRMYVGHFCKIKLQLFFFQKSFSSYYIDFFLYNDCTWCKQEPDIKTNNMSNQEIVKMAAICNGLTWPAVFMFKYTCKARLAWQFC